MAQLALPSQSTTYSLTTGVRLDIEDAIYLLSPFDTPLLGEYGVDATGRTILPKGNVTEKKYSWLDEALLTPKSTSANNTSTTGTAYITVATGDQNKFSTGDVVFDQTTGEYMRVTGYGTTTDTLTVTRGFASSTAKNVATSDLLMNLGAALKEGSNPEDPRAVDRSQRDNYTQIFGPTAVRVSGTEQVVKKYGLGGQTEFTHQLANRMKEEAIKREQALIYGVQLEDTGNGWRTHGGLDYFITTGNGSYVDSSTTSLSESALLDALQTIFDNGGTPDRAMMGLKQKRVVSSFTSAGTIFIQRNDIGRGVVVSYFDSDFGRITAHMDRWIAKPNLYLFNREQAEVPTLRPMVFEMLAKTGDSDYGQIVGEYGFKFRQPRFAGKFTALT